LAGFLGKAGQRKSAAVVGALGAVLTVLPKALPERQDLEAKLSAADKHHTVGAKFRNQFIFANPSESLTEAQKYVSARFTDCSALNPPAAIPDFPKTSAEPIDDGRVVLLPSDPAVGPVAPTPSPAHTVPPVSAPAALPVVHQPFIPARAPLHTDSTF
ncbi:MAG: hypothetical protein ACLP1X_26940, partial [Polyangiaceae bacterium]